jgi:hypothetical protein
MARVAKSSVRRTPEVRKVVRHTGFVRRATDFSPLANVSPLNGGRDDERGAQDGRGHDDGDGDVSIFFERLLDR